jgi:hypothetical protein
MSGELVDQLRASDFFREMSLGYDTTFSSVLTPGLGTAGQMRGVSFQKINYGSATGTPAVPNEYYNVFSTIPANITMGTGLTFFLTVTDDGADSADLSKVLVFGIAVKKITSGATADLSASAGTEQSTSVTLNATTGNTAQFSLAIANANLNSAAVGDQIGVRIRRIGSSTVDTCNGRVVVLGGHIKNT